MSPRIVYPVPVMVIALPGIPVRIKASSVNAEASLVDVFQKSEPKQQLMMYIDPYGTLTTREKAFSVYESEISKQRCIIETHELAHLYGAEEQAIGTPQYNKISDPDGREIILGGQQGINVPGPVSPKSPLDLIIKTIVAALKTIAGAEAPSDGLSDADKNVANQGRRIYNIAVLAKNEREKINEKIQNLNGTKPEGKLNPEQINQADNFEGSNGFVRGKIFNIIV
jgi:hypothetical protein